MDKTIKYISYSCFAKKNDYLDTAFAVLVNVNLAYPRDVTPVSSRAVARSRQKRLSGMKGSRGERNGGTSPV